MKERKHMDKNQDAIEHYLDDVVIALNQRHANLEMEIKGEYNGIKDEVRNKVHPRLDLVNVVVRPFLFTLIYPVWIKSKICQRELEVIH